MFYKKNKFYKYFFAILLSFFLFLSFFSFSSIAYGNDTFGTGFIENDVNLGAKDPRETASRVINIGLSILSIIAVVIVLFGGFTWMTSGGNEEKIEKAKKILKAGVIGLIIILSAWGITLFVLSRLGDATGTNSNINEPGDPSGCVGFGCPCVGAGCYGSDCNKVVLGGGNVCDPDDTICQSNLDLVCNKNSCKCLIKGEGDPCGNVEDGVCTADNTSCEEKNSNLFCNNSCLCQLKTDPDDDDDFSELGDPCSGGDSCNADNKTCNPAHGLSCDSSSCVCVGNPIITGISPVGGFCNNDINKPCVDNSVCGGSTCNNQTPNSTKGNLVTIFGYNFDNYNSNISEVNFIRISDNKKIKFIKPVSVNSYCNNFWSNKQIIAVFPDGFSVGDDIEVEVITKDNKSDKSNDLIGPKVSLIKVNEIERPGVCSISSDSAKINEDIHYYGVNLKSGQVYFGNPANSFLGFSPNGAVLETYAFTKVPNLAEGDTSTFVKRLNVFSNFLDFTKLADLPQGPSISFFDPADGSSGQYITIYGKGFNNIKGLSSVYFRKNSIDKEADFNFPLVCLQSVWSDNQIIVKVPEGTANGQYDLVLKVGSWPEVIANQVFKVDSSLKLKPSLCKISPVSGPNNSIVSLWGEYFGLENKNPSTIFNINKEISNVSVLSENGADKISVNVPSTALTGPVKIKRDNLEGNSLNFTVGSCSENKDCEGNKVCCKPGSVNAGSCVIDETLDCSGDVPDNSVFQWGFKTGFISTTPTSVNPVYSCASYDFCPTTAWACPNSPGLCSSYDGKKLVEIGSCKQDCSDFKFCTESGASCSYFEKLNNKDFDKCIKNNFSCSLDQAVSYDLGGEIGLVEKTKICRSFNTPNGIKNYYEISTNTICPKIGNKQWIKSPSGSCVDALSFGSNSTCTLCPNESSCQNIDGQANPVCVSNKLCPNNSICYNKDGFNNKCVKEDFSSCQCCCDKSKNNASSGTNPACCPSLTCDYTCGASANENPKVDNFGLCSGCNIGGASTATKDLACNCTGTSGKYCETSGYPKGACLDCTALGEENCKAHNTSCCWDKKEGVCHGGISDASVWGNDSGNIGFCPYYNCDTINITKCSNSPVIEGSYANKENCDTACKKNCSNYSDINSCKNDSVCCWAQKTGESSGSCVAGTRFNSSDAYCAYFNCNSTDKTCSKSSTNSSDKEYFTQESCSEGCKQDPYGIGLSCKTASADNKCDPKACNIFTCLLSDGKLATENDCGVCCCDPKATIDQCGEINNKLSCLANKDACSGADRGLCCGCKEDKDCVSSGSAPSFVGCGMDSCCKARPKIELDNDTLNKSKLKVSPIPKSENVCRNVVVEISFDQKIDKSSLNNNILLLKESDTVCPSGTYFIGKADLNSINKKSIFSFLKDIFVKTSNYLTHIFNKNAIAATPMLGPSVNKIYCAVLGDISVNNKGDKTTVYFEPDRLLDANSVYFVIVVGDKNLNSFDSTSVKSANKISLNGDGYFYISSFTKNLKYLTFNKISYQNSYIWDFRTIDIGSDNSGICAIDYVDINPSSYLFKSNTSSINENDINSEDETFDSINDRDKVYTAKAYSKDGQILNPVNSYNWSWEWLISNSKVFSFSDNIIANWADATDKKIIEVNEGVTDGKSNITAKIKLDPNNTINIGDGIYKNVPAYVLICDNPWPTFNSDGTWDPWKDNDIAVQSNYEFYYCRDAGSFGTADDLPAFLSDMAVTKGNSLTRVCSNAPSQICSDSTPCPSGGICLASFLKETYFFKERIPRFVKDVVVSDNGTGGSLNISWDSEKELVNTYKVYYSFPDSSNLQYLIVDPKTSACQEIDDKYSCSLDINGLINYQQYDIKITALSANLAETNFSLTVSKTPTEGNVSSVPQNLQSELINNKKIVLKWEAPVGFTVSKYKIYMGSSAGLYGQSFTTKDNSTEYNIEISDGNLGAYYFAVSSIGISNNESSRSNEIYVEFSPDYKNYSWQDIGRSISVSTYYPSLFVYNGYPYISSGGYALRTLRHGMRKMTDSWASVGENIISAGGGSFILKYTSLYIENNNLYVAYQDSNSGNDKVNVIKFNENENKWDFVGYPNFSEEKAYSISLSVYNDTPYVFYIDDPLSGKGFVMRFKKTENKWEKIGSIGDKLKEASLGDSIKDPSLFIYEGVPYIAFRVDGKMTVMKYVESKNNWDFVGPNRLSDGSTFYSSLFVYNGVPYVAYSDYGYGRKIVVKKYTGSVVGGWENVGSAEGFSVGQADYISLFVYNSIPYVAYSDYGYGRKIVVKKYTGLTPDGWENIGSDNGVSVSGADNVSLFIHNNTPYVSYKDLSNSRPVIMKFDKK